jgi:hypothetical protein
MHPVDAALSLLKRHGTPCGDLEIAIAAIERMLASMVDDGLRECPDCGEPWYLTGPVREYFESRDLHVPTRCKPCRDRRRTALAARGLR